MRMPVRCADCVCAMARRTPNCSGVASGASACVHMVSVGSVRSRNNASRASRESGVNTSEDGSGQIKKFRLSPLPSPSARAHNLTLHARTRPLPLLYPTDRTSRKRVRARGEEPLRICIPSGPHVIPNADRVTFTEHASLVLWPYPPSLVACDDQSNVVCHAYLRQTMSSISGHQIRARSLRM